MINNIVRMGMIKYNVLVLFLDAKTQVKIGQHLPSVVSMFLFCCPPLVALPPQHCPSPSANYPAARFDEEI